MKSLLYLIRDVFLTVVVVAIVAGGIWGVVLPYRQTFVGSGPYQLQAFDSGLAFFHYGQGETPFYNLSPLNDFIVSPDGTRSALLSQEASAKHAYTATFTLEKPEAIVAAIKQFWGKVMPWYTVTSTDMKAEYTSQRTDKGMLIQRTITWDRPRTVAISGMSLWYNAADIVIDGVTHEAYTPVTASESALISDLYHLSVKPMTEELYTPVESHGSVLIVNPSRPGVLEVVAGFDQTLIVNREYRLIEVTRPVNQRLTTISDSMTVQGLFEEGQ